MNTVNSELQHDLEELCALFSTADEWGQRMILQTARRQASCQPNTNPLPTLTLVRPGALCDQGAHVLNHTINRRPLTLVRQPIDTQ